MKSIMHERKDGTCWLCIKLHGDYSRKSVLHEHHAIGGTANRKQSEKYGLKVYLCIEHHLYDGGPEAVHRNNRIRRYVETAAQAAFEKHFPWLDFKDIFGRYASWEQAPEEEHEESGCRQQAGGIIPIDGLPPLPDYLKD